jgi:hypothetical protein
MHDLACVGLRRNEHPQKNVITIEPRHSGRSPVLTREISPVVLGDAQWLSLGEVARAIVDRLREAVLACPGRRP